MKQSEKLDAVLKFLYTKRYDQNHYMVSNVLDELNIEHQGMQEAAALAGRLERDGYVNLIQISSDRSLISINTYGIDYCENSSYQNPGTSLINYTFNMNITNSPNANIVSQSKNTNINIANYDAITVKIDTFKEQLRTLETLTSNEKFDILECLTEIETCLQNGRKPKFSLTAFLSQTANVAGIGSLALEIGKLINGS